MKYWFGSNKNTCDNISRVCHPLSNAHIQSHSFEAAWPQWSRVSSRNNVNEWIIKKEKRGDCKHSLGSGSACALVRCPRGYTRFLLHLYLSLKVFMTCATKIIEIPKELRTVFTPKIQHLPLTLLLSDCYRSVEGTREYENVFKYTTQKFFYGTTRNISTFSMVFYNLLNLSWRCFYKLGRLSSLSHCSH